MCKDNRRAGQLRITVRLIKLAVSIALFCLDCVGSLSRQLIRKPRRTLCVVLYYHVVRGEDIGHFKRQMRLFKSSCTPIAPGEAFPEFGRRRYGALTFDDAFTSVREFAVPVLSEYRIPFAVFVPTGSIGKRPTWVPQEGHRFSKQMVMTEDQLRHLARNPLVKLGSHTVTHCRLTACSQSKTRAELEESKEHLERISGRRITLFSYPHGEHSNQVDEVASQAGYVKLFTILPTTIGKGGEENTWGRIAVEPADWPLEFRLKLSGAYRWMAPFTRLKRAVSRVGRFCRSAA